MRGRGGKGRGEVDGVGVHRRTADTNSSLMWGIQPLMSAYDHATYIFLQVEED